jgi:cell division protein FtsQ
VSSQPPGQRRGRQGRIGYAPPAPQVPTNGSVQRTAGTPRRTTGAAAVTGGRVGGGRAGVGGPRRNSVRANSSTTLVRARPARPLVSRVVLLALLSKLVGLAVLWGASSLLYDVVSSPDFTIGRVSVTGNRLLTPEEVELTASASGLNVFWIRRAELGRRLQLLPPVESAWVALELPDHVLIEVKEREPVAIWLTSNTPYLVDRDGLVLAARQPSKPLLMVHDPTDQALVPGDRVNAEAVRNIASIDGLLGATFGDQQRQYEYLPSTGMNVVQSVGPRLILGGADDLDWKMAALQTIVKHLQSERTNAELIDVRFRERPYYR